MNLKQRKTKISCNMHTKWLGIHFLTWKKRLSNVYHKRHRFSLSIQDDKWARVKYTKEKQKLTEIKKNNNRNIRTSTRDTTFSRVKNYMAVTLQLKSITFPKEYKYWYSQYRCFILVYLQQARIVLIWANIKELVGDKCESIMRCLSSSLHIARMFKLSG